MWNTMSVRELKMRSEWIPFRNHLCLEKVMENFRPQLWLPKITIHATKSFCPFVFFFFASIWVFCFYLLNSVLRLFGCFFSFCCLVTREYVLFVKWPCIGCLSTRFGSRHFWVVLSVFSMWWPLTFLIFLFFAVKKPNQRWTLDWDDTFCGISWGNSLRSLLY